MSDSDSHDCPLCMEAFEIDDLHFYPCTCGYQICRFCWHRIRTDGNGLCPACRKTYTEDPAMYRALSHDEIQKVKKERKQKEAQQKQKLSDNRQHLSSIRVIQRHLVFVVGLSNKMADTEVLKRPEYFGSYGKIVKIVINPNTNYAGPQGPSASAYITYTKEEDALKAILSINEMQPPLKIRASLGTTKYCTHYLRNMQCPKVDCMYLHDLGDPEASFTKEDMQAGKHQLFEKNLLENYIKNHQEKELESQDSYDEYDSADQLETNSQEDWLDEPENLDNVNSLDLSWGSSKEEKDIDIYSNEQQSSEYLLLEPCIRSPKNSVDEPIQLPLEAIQPTPIPICTPKSLPPVSTLNISKESAMSQDFSTGWATSYEVPVAEPNVTSNNLLNNNFLWPTTSDLGLSDLKINPSDDDLGFDPFNESKNGLEDLMASEKQLGPEPPSAPPPLFRWDPFWPSSYGSNQNQMPLMNSYSLFGASQPMPAPHAQYRPPLNQYQIPPPMRPPNNHLQMMLPNTNQFQFSSPHQSQTHRFPIQLPQSNSIQRQNQQHMNQYHQSYTHIPSSRLSHPPEGSSDHKNWQDGLRALLPNINISFSNQEPEKKLSEKWSNIDITGPPPVPLPEIDRVNISSPPLGVKGHPTICEAKQPWIPSAEKTGSLPPPPPGFDKPLEAFISLPQPGLLNAPTGPPGGTSVPNKFISTNPVTITNTTPGGHDDPSILWSKVLKDVPKEIETTDRAFPLPGENLKSGSPQESPHSIPLITPSPNHLTSWNTIVRGSQISKDPTKIEIESSPSKLHQQPLQLSLNESVDLTPQKSPIFGHQQKQSIKQKPTATVKPLKCNSAIDGFTTVQNSRQINMHSIVANSTPSTGSRVSELDDFSADLPGRIPNATNHVAEYPVAAAPLPAKNNAKKKRRKAKDQMEQVAEVTVGRCETERPPVPILDVERPKKPGKVKKKSVMKMSPPTPRKFSSIEKNEELLCQPIRILKSDGNSRTTTLSPAQVPADSHSVPKTVNSTNHDHEIVSRLTESTEKLLKNVLFETEAIKLNTEQISKDLKSALEKCKESSLSLSDLEKINLLLTPGKIPAGLLEDQDTVDTYYLEKQVESARREAKMLEVRLNDVIRKNMASELETLKRNTKNSPE